MHARVGRGGWPLSIHARNFLEPRLGVDLGSVRTHADADAGALAQRVHARAFTLGQDIFFAPGELRPQTGAGMRLLAHEVAHTLQSGTPRMAQRFGGLIGPAIIRRAPPDAAAGDAGSSTAEATVITGWRGNLRTTVIDLIIGLDPSVSLDRAIVLAEQLIQELEVCFDDASAGQCLVFAEEDVTSIEHFEELMQGQAAVAFYDHMLERVAMELGVDLAQFENPVSPDYSARPDVVESIQDPWAYYQRVMMAEEDLELRRAYVVSWIERLGLTGLTAVMGVEGGEKALLYSYADLWEPGFDEDFVPIGDAIISVVAPARGLGEVFESIPLAMFQGASFDGENIVLELERTIAFESLRDGGTTEEGRREFTKTGTITVPADTVLVLWEGDLRRRTSALKLLQITAQSPNNVLEALEVSLVEGAKDVNALIGDTVEQAGKLVVESLASGKTKVIANFLDLASNIADEGHRDLAIRAILALDGLADAILVGISATVGLVGGAVKGVVGLSTGFASVGGAAIGVIEDLAAWIIDGDFEQLQARVEDIITLVDELGPAVKAAFAAWTEEFQAADPNEKARLIGDAVGQILAVIAEVLVGTKTGTIRELRDNALEQLERVRKATKDVAERAAAKSITAGKKALAQFDEFGDQLTGTQSGVEKQIWEMLGIKPGGGMGGPPPAPAAASLDGGGSAPGGRVDENALLHEATDGGGKSRGGKSTRKAEFVSYQEFEQRAQAKFGGAQGRLPLGYQRPGGGNDVEIDLITSDALIQIKRVTAPEATFGKNMRDQFNMTMDAAKLSGYTKVIYVVASEAPETFIKQLQEMPHPKNIELIIERLSAGK